MTKTSIIGWIGSITGLIGAGLLSFNAEFSSFGWVAFLVSNIAWIAYALSTKTKSLLVMQAGFMLTTLNGLSNWFA